VGSLSLETSPTRWRMRHVGSMGMAVRDDWQGKGVGTALMEAALDLADNWLNLTRIEVTVYVDNAFKEFCELRIAGVLGSRYAGCCITSWINKRSCPIAPVEYSQDRPRLRAF
jgi:GNAT superfamily N-acetyltransferase